MSMAPEVDLASDVMGLSIPGSQVGGGFPYTFSAAAAYIVDGRSAAEQTMFNAMELYLMGLAAPSEVGHFVVLNDQQHQVTVGLNTLQPSQSTVVSIDDVIAAHGAADSPKVRRRPNRFVLPQSFCLSSCSNVYVMSFYDWFAARRASLTTRVPCSEGFSQYICSPFSVATGGRANDRLLHRSAIYGRSTGARRDDCPCDSYHRTPLTY